MIVTISIHSVTKIRLGNLWLIVLMLINSWQIIQFLIVLVFAGIELIFFIVACMVLLGF